MGFINKSIDYDNMQNIFDASRHLYDANEAEKAIEVLKDLANRILDNENHSN